MQNSQFLVQKLERNWGLSPKFLKIPVNYVSNYVSKKPVVFFRHIIYRIYRIGEVTYAEARSRGGDRVSGCAELFCRRQTLKSTQSKTWIWLHGAEHEPKR